MLSIPINITFVILLGLLGAALASFFNAQIFRLEKELPIKELLTKSSSCEKCGRQLTVVDLFPVLGWLISNGKCPKCEYKVPIIYPLTELAFGIAFILLYLNSATFLAYFLISSVGFLALYDLQYKGFPRWIMNGLLGIGIIYFIILVLMGESTLLSPTLLIAVTISIIVLIINLFQKSFGLGDVLVLLYLSLFMTWQELLGIVWTSSIIGGIYAVPMLLLKKISRKDKVPFVPFIWIGLLCVIIFKQSITDYIDSMFSLWYFISS